MKCWVGYNQLDSISFISCLATDHQYLMEIA